LVGIHTRFDPGLSFNCTCLLAQQMDSQVRTGTQGLGKLMPVKAI